MTKDSSTTEGMPIFGKKVTPSPVQDATIGAKPGDAPIFGKKTANPAHHTDAASGDTPIFGKKTTSVAQDTANGIIPDDKSIFEKKTKPAVTPNVTPTPAVVAPRQPMTPKAKKKLILGIVIGLGILAIIAVVIIILLVINHIDYKPAYEKAKDINDTLSSIEYNSSCSYVVNNVDSAYYSEKEYNKFIEKCRTAGDELNALVVELGDTDAVKKDTNVKEKYDKFKSDFDKTYLATDVDDKLELYKAYHNFIVAEDDLDYYGGNTDKILEEVADYLINSGNATLKKYGEDWLKLRKAVEAAYKAYYDADWSAENHNQLYNAYSDAYDAYTDFVYDEDLEWDEIAELDTDLSDARSTFKQLYRAIGEKYDGAKK